MLLFLAVLKLALKLELGPEYDSNANRAEVVAGAQVVDMPTGSFLVRSTARGSLAWRHKINLLRASGLVGGKVFFDPAVQDQNTLVVQLGLEDRVRATSRLELFSSGDYYDATQMAVAPPCAFRSCDRHRDYRSGTGLVGFSLFDDPGALIFSGGYRGFVWKPDESFDFHAGRASLDAIVRLRAGPADQQTEIDLSASYRLERRVYAGLREYSTCAPSSTPSGLCISNAPDHRADWFHEGQIELTYVRSILLSLAYGLQLNASNSFGQSLLRHLITLKVSTRLPWELYLTLKGQLLLTRYFDPLLLDREVNSQTFISIEDENRNAAICDLERAIGQTGLSALARYSFFTNEISSSPVSFMRHVVYVGLSYRISR